MSWKLAKKFQQANLGPFSSLHRSAGASVALSTPVGIDSKPVAESSAVKDGPTTTPGTNASNTIPPLSGILIVTLHEAQDLSIPEHYHSTSSTQQFGNSRSVTANSLPRPDASTTLPRRSQFSAEHGLQGGPSNQGRQFGKFMPYALVDFDKTQVLINSVDGTPEHPLWAGSGVQYKFDVSRATDLSVHLFIRNHKPAPDLPRTQDTFLGVVRLHPRFETGDKTRSHGSGLEHSGVGWVDIQHGSGRLHIGVEFASTRMEKLCIDDFELLKVVGKGSFGKVMQVRKKDTNRIYALKTIRKAKIISRAEVVHTLAERSVLAQINNPFIVPLKFTFQSPEKLYFVLAFVNGGELFHHLTKEGRFDINRARFYTAELICVLDCLHGFNVIYRDLKPENILLDYQGHIALCDFGLCKLEMKDEDHTNTFCGTPEYLAPELLLGHSYNKAVDWWTLGVLLYEMLTGLPPFYDESTNEMYRKILSEPLHFPSQDIVPPAAKDLLMRLLNRNPAERLGANGSAEIKSHPFFNAIDWRKLLQRKYEPAFKPKVSSALDTANFDSDFTSELPQDSFVDDPVLSQTMQNQFTGFSYNRPVAGLNDAGGSIMDASFLDQPSSRR